MVSENKALFVFLTLANEVDMKMSCMTQFKRWLFFLFNSIFFCLGLGVLTVGIISRIQTDKWDDLVSSPTFFDVGNLFMAAGAIVTVIAITGCCGALKKWKWMLAVYALLVVVIFALEVYAGGDAFVNRDKVTEQLSDGLRTTVNSDFGGRDPAAVALTKATDWLQEHLECCGAGNYLDWKSSHWYNSTGRVDNVEVPKTCCKTQSELCNRKGDDIESRIWVKGCVDAASKFSMDHLWKLGTAALVIAFVELSGVALAINLICALKKEGAKPTTTV
jgi:Ca2+/Na+ antiporter